MGATRQLAAIGKTSPLSAVPTRRNERRYLSESNGQLVLSYLVGFTTEERGGEGAYYPHLIVQAALVLLNHLLQ